ncbi:MAG TPA: hypothetical protein VHP58_07125 [Alphaproteobacteria bacterium]|nr:hypothetical protein [Alphaproteobacteria bacterium]
MKTKNIFLLALLLAPLGACTASDINCPICYEDEWSREPFPGQPKQHIPTPHPDKIPE